jgi:hypothetical protein
MARVHFHTFDPRVEMYSTKRMNLVHFSIFVQNEGSVLRSIFFYVQTYSDLHEILRVDRELRDKHFIFLVRLHPSSFDSIFGPYKVSNSIRL